MKIGVLTSGGDAPGMNTCLWALAQACERKGHVLYTINKGYQGLISNWFQPADINELTKNRALGGTCIQSARCKEFMTIEGRRQAQANVESWNLDALIVIGGDGTFAGAHQWLQEFDFPIIGIPGTIDNDLYGTDSTLGYDTALNTVMDALDRISDTAGSHDRLFLVEVMGKDAGFIALRSAIAGGAQEVFVPETPNDYKALVKKLAIRWNKGQRWGLLVVAEGDEGGGAQVLSEILSKELPYWDNRVTLLGHVQRGGRPSAYDRVLAAELALEAIHALEEGQRDLMVGIQGRSLARVPFEQAIKHHKNLKQRLLDLMTGLNG